MSDDQPQVPAEDAAPSTPPRPEPSDLAFSDDLTGIYNRRYLRQLFESEWTALVESHGRVALLLLDLDLFKEVNDGFGHLAGDAVLRTVARRLRESFRDGDRVVRFGGDEFVVVLPGVGEEEARRLAERARSALATERWHDPATGRSIELPLSFSIGLAASPADGAFGEDVLAAADRQLYEEKRSRRARLAAVLAPPRRRPSTPLTLLALAALALFALLVWRLWPRPPSPVIGPVEVERFVAAEELGRREAEIRALREEVERLRASVDSAGSAAERERFAARIRELETALERRAAVAKAPLPAATPTAAAAEAAATAPPPRETPRAATPEPAAARVPEPAAPPRTLEIVPPQLVRHRAPSYPPLALARGLEARIDFRVRVGPDGRVAWLEPLGAPAGNGFDSAARAAAESALYRPGTRDGEPVEMETTLRIEFKLAATRGR